MNILFSLLFKGGFKITILSFILLLITYLRKYYVETITLIKKTHYYKRLNPKFQPQGKVVQLTFVSRCFWKESSVDFLSVSRHRPTIRYQTVKD